MIDSSILARACAPEVPEVTPSVRLLDLREWTLEAVQRSPAREPLINAWARTDYRERRAWREEYGLISVAHEMMTRGLRDGDFALRVHDGLRAWRIPCDAFAAWGPDTDLEMTWTGGRLWEPDASSPFKPVADLELPLLTTEAEAEAHRRRVLTEIADLEASAPTVRSVRRTTLEQQVDAALAAVPAPDPSELRAWVDEWSGNARWPLRQALLWVAFRDFDEVAKAVLTSFWSGNENLGIAGAALAQCDLEQQVGIARLVERQPASRLVHALTVNLRAHGLFEGAGPMALIEAPQWENLEFGVPPEGQRGRSDAWQSAARVKDQIHGPGIAWQGHWTGIKVERTDLFAWFPAIPVGRDDRDDSDTAVDATIRRLSDERGSPIPRNKGAADVRKLHPSRTQTSIRKRIEAIYPSVSPGPKGSRAKRAE